MTHPRVRAICRLAVAWTLAFCLLSCEKGPGPPSDSDVVVATVNKEPITLRALKTEVAKVRGLSPPAAARSGTRTEVSRALRQLVKEGRFRSDLYYRLNIFPIHLPPLRQRKEDIPMLVEQFLEDICGDYGVAAKNIDDDAVKLLQDYNWTGNIRELRNVVERLVILSGKNITAEDVKSYVMPR